MSDGAKIRLHFCPVCREQVLADRDGDHAHYHDDSYVEAVLVEIPAPEIPGLDRLLADALAEHERQERERAERQERERAEIAAVEEEWRASAPAEQVEAYERKLERSKSMGDVMRDVFTAPDLERQLYGSSPLLDALSEDERPDWMKQHDDAAWRNKERDRARGTIAQFGEHGPERVSFYQLRDARKRLDELGADDALPKGWRPRKGDPLKMKAGVIGLRKDSDA